MQSEQLRNTLFTIRSSCPEISVLSQTNGLQLAIWYPLSDKRSSAGNLISPLSQTKGLQLAIWYPLSVRQTVFIWQSDIPSQSDKRYSSGNLISPLSQTKGLQLAIWYPLSDKRSSAGNLISPLSQTNGLQLAIWYPLSVRQRVFSWQSDIPFQTNGLQLAIWYPLSVRQTVFIWQSDVPSHIFWRPSRVSKLGNICDFKYILPLAPPDRISPYQSLCCYLTHWQSFPNISHHQIMISITDNWDIKHVPSPVSQYAIDLNMSLSIRRDPSAFSNVLAVCLWESHLSMRQKLSIVTTLSIQPSLKLSFITFGFKLSPFFQFCIIFFKGNFGMALRKWPNTRSKCSYKLIFYCQFYSHLTQGSSEQYHISKLLPFHMA